MTSIYRQLACRSARLQVQETGCLLIQVVAVTHLRESSCSRDPPHYLQQPTLQAHMLWLPGKRGVPHLLFPLTRAVRVAKQREQAALDSVAFSEAVAVEAAAGAAIKLSPLTSECLPESPVWHQVSRWFEVLG
ncbi:hypothetical protein DUNSADRAFT_12986 [Dunaliella salina]|uniref:Encoded protein n=1 Tax=Dunaliella salina TaxID=3046 RepID=A0ABQ7GAB3_DUNSA|nr:hypothetical protein DUNSADRAFT_12986 [Dunaliella salina]|eukprot:KAF5831540.1 hypothetical protein DUNSADRAFT_12986 [Dunaliella salina]